MALTPKLQDTIDGLSQIFEGSKKLGMSDEEIIRFALKSGVADVALRVPPVEAAPASIPVDATSDYSFREPGKRPKHAKRARKKGRPATERQKEAGRANFAKGVAAQQARAALRRQEEERARQAAQPDLSEERIAVDAVVDEKWGGGAEARLARPPIKVKLKLPESPPEAEAIPMPDWSAPATLNNEVREGRVPYRNPRDVLEGDPEYRFPPAVIGRNHVVQCTAPVALKWIEELRKYPHGTRFNSYEIAKALGLIIHEKGPGGFTWKGFNHMLLREGFHVALCRDIIPGSCKPRRMETEVGVQQLWVVDHHEANRRYYLGVPADQKIELTLPYGKQPVDPKLTRVSEREFEKGRTAGGRRRRIDPSYRPQIVAPRPEPAPQPAPQPGKFAALHRQTIETIDTLSNKNPELRKVAPNGHAGD